MILISGCTKRQVEIPKPTNSVSQYKAFEQHDAADVSILFYWWGDITVLKPSAFWGRHLTKEELRKLISPTVPKTLAVVALDKREHKSYPDQATLLNEIESFFFDIGFERVVVQQSIGDEHPDGLPILRDTSKRSRRP